MFDALCHFTEDIIQASKQSIPYDANTYLERSINIARRISDVRVSMKKIYVEPKRKNRVKTRFDIVLRFEHVLQLYWIIERPATQKIPS